MCAGCECDCGCDVIFFVVSSDSIYGWYKQSAAVVPADIVFCSKCIIAIIIIVFSVFPNKKYVFLLNRMCPWNVMYTRRRRRQSNPIPPNNPSNQPIICIKKNKL